MNVKDFSAALMEISEELREMTKLPRRTAEIAAPKIDAIVQAEFKAGQSPTGETWAPLKDGEARVPLNLSGRMEGSLRVVAEGVTIRGKIRAPANIHQYGSARGSKRNVPARPIFPGKNDPLPETWEKVVEEAGDQAFTELTGEIRKRSR